MFTLMLIMMMSTVFCEHSVLSSGLDTVVADKGCHEISNRSELDLNLHQSGWGYAPVADASSMPTVVRLPGKLANPIAPYIFCKSGGIAYRCNTHSFINQTRLPCHSYD